MHRLGLGVIATKVRMTSHQIIIRRLLGPLTLALNPNITAAQSFAR